MKPDFYSETWKWVEGELSKQLRVDREKLEGNIPELETAKIRGRIEFLKNFLREADKLANPKRPGNT